jgi:hypothetical protein
MVRHTGAGRSDRRRAESARHSDGRGEGQDMMRSKLAILLLTAAAWSAWATRVPGVRAAEPAALEQQVKSAFVVNFLQFTDWPAETFAKADDPIVIGILDPKSLGDALAAAIQGKSVKGRKLEARAVSAETAGGCQVLIVGQVEGADLQKALQGAAGRPVLTIGDAEEFTAKGGIIRFYVEDRKERFEINQAAAQRAQLQISSKLLKLAKVVNN